MISTMLGKPDATISVSRTISVAPTHEILQIEAGVYGPEPGPTRGFAVRVNTPEMADFIAGMFTRAAELLRERSRSRGGAADDEGTVQS